MRPKPRAINAYAGVHPINGWIRGWTLKGTARGARDEIAKVYDGDWSKAKKDGWRVVAVEIRPR